ncbi:glycoside hydrolase family 95-like protein [Brachybacterium sillae]|uniref:glycoside hydrolase family 95-like protein n=1 Tax=Brachybacterium sillae TaxID=2810536 RepID=UPI003D81449B
MHPNLFATHPPFQIDGNLGIPAVVAKMLLQSHDGVIRVLPALPQAWAERGSFTGLRARGGYRVDCAWRKGRVTALHVIADRTTPGPVEVIVDGRRRTVQVRPR